MALRDREQFHKGDRVRVKQDARKHWGTRKLAYTGVVASEPSKNARYDEICVLFDGSNAKAGKYWPATYFEHTPSYYTESVGDCNVKESV